MDKKGTEPSWKYIKDLAANGFIAEPIAQFLVEKHLSTDTRTDQAVKDMQVCIINSETEAGVKSCITTGVEDLSPLFIGPGFKRMAKELYDKILKTSEEEIAETWGKFIL